MISYEDVITKAQDPEAVMQKLQQMNARRKR